VELRSLELSVGRVIVGSGWRVNLYMLRARRHGYRNLPDDSMGWERECQMRDEPVSRHCRRRRAPDGGVGSGGRRSGRMDGKAV